MQLILIRHARPERVEGAAGAADPPLTDIGHRQAAAAADWLASEAIDALYVSPMARAVQTSAPLERLLGLTATIEARVREFDSDEDTYIPMEEVRADKAAWKAWLEEEMATDRSDFASECISGLTDIVGAHGGQNVAVVCHGGVINVWAAHVLGLDPNNMFFEPDYTSIHRFMASSKGHRSLVSLNEAAHLRSDPALLLR